MMDARSVLFKTYKLVYAVMLSFFFFPFGITALKLSSGVGNRSTKAKSDMCEEQGWEAGKEAVWLPASENRIPKGG